MTISGMEAWITSATEDKDVRKALLLAASLRRVYTAKKLVALTSFPVFESSSKELRRIFDLVVPLVPGKANGLEGEDWAKVEAFSMTVFDKCAYLSPNTMVLKNCDDIFEKYGNLASLGDENGLDSSVVVFTPSEVWGGALELITTSIGPSISAHLRGTSAFDKCFSMLVQNNIPDWKKLDGQYNVLLDLKSGRPLSMNTKMAIVNFGDSHPSSFVDNGFNKMQEEFGPVEKYVVEVSRRLYAEGVEPSLHPSQLAIPSEAYKTEPIAIVGMSFRLPGGNNVDEFWDLLINGKEAIRYLPEDRWTHQHTSKPCEHRQVQGGFLSIPVDEFDAKFFGISGKEAEVLDPQIRLLHEITWEALEDAMIDPLSLRESHTGIFVGSWLHNYLDMMNDTTDYDEFRGYMGTSFAARAARLSHFYETTGPSIGTETGCSSAIVGVDMACKSLRSHDCNMALACGVNLLLKPFDRDTFSFVVSPEGRCKTFDESANGFGRAEGCAVLVLKRLSDALNNEDKIWGLIRGTGVTQEGVSKSFGTPTIHCESLAMRMALKDANVDPADVSYVEAHGTGTPVGDPMEINAIAQAYHSKGRSAPLVIGSVKTNVGHTESASGITGIIKVILSMKNEKIPQHLNLKKLNPAINLESIPATIPLEAVPWPKAIDKPRVAGISSFGISGADGHVIVQEPPMVSLVQVHENGVTPRALHIMKISAKSPESFQNLLTTYENIFAAKEASDGFADLAYSANIGRATFNHRAVIIAKDFKEARAAIENKSFKHAEVQSSGSQLCFLFTGQGSQYPNMGASLYATSPFFRTEFNKCDRILTKKYGINMREVLWGQSSDEKELSRTLFSQTSIFCIEYCLLKLWESWGVKPDFVMGHSLGEFAAAVAAGVLDFEDGLMLVAERSRLIDSLPQGKMLVIRADKETVDKNIEKFTQVNPKFWVDYAALNSPDQTVVAGDSAMIEEFAKYCGEKSLKTIVLAATHAFHSRHMDPMLEAYRRVAQTITPSRASDDAPKYISGMDGKLTDLNLIDAEYWVRHTREPVRYIDACKVVHSEGCSLFLEVGPHPVLSALTMMNAGDGSVSCLPSIRKKDDEWATMLDTLAKLYLSEWKGQVDWKNFDRYYNRTRVSLPFYPFNRKSIWLNMEGPLPNVHPLLGRPVPTECDHTIFEKKLTLKNTSYVRDHVIGNTVIYPGAAFLEMCVAGGHAGLQASISPIERTKPIRPIILKSLKIMSPLALYDSSVCRLQTSTKLNVDEEDEISYSVGVQRYVPSTSDGLGEWTTHATASYFPVPATSTKDKSLPRHIDIQAVQATWKKSDCRNFYEKLPETGLRFGPKFQSLGTCWKGDEGMLIRVEIPEEDNNCYLVHPLIGDAMIQASMLWNNKDTKAKMKLQVPVGVDEFMWYQTSESSRLYLYCRTNDSGKTECLLLDGEGARLARMTGVDFVETTVKLVEGMIQQHKTAMPKLWREVWRSDPGALQSSYDFTSTLTKPFLQFSDDQENIFGDLNDPGVEERTFYDDLCKLVRLYFLNAMYEIGWKPIQGTAFTLEELVKLLPQPKEHFQRYIQFFLRELAETGTLVEDSYAGRKYRFAGVPPTHTEIQKGLEQLITREEDRARPEYKLIVEAGRNMSKVWLGEVDPLQILFPESASKPNAGQFYVSLKDLVGPVMNKVNDSLFREVLDKCYDVASTSSPPVLRVLEVGSGTGSFTESNLECLARWGKPFEFYYTDISASFFSAAETKFEKYSKQMVFKKFDMEEDPLAQGLSPNYFDIILASEVMHVAKDISQTLSNLKCLLKPGGMFQIVETTLPDLVITQIFGILDGYWGFQDLELRPDHITLTPDKWEKALKGIGCDSVVCKLAYNNVHGIITGRLSQTENQPVLQETSEHSWLIFGHDSSTGVVDSLKEKLAGVNRNVRIATGPSDISEESMKGYMKLQLRPLMEGVEKVEGVVYLWGLNDDGVANRDQAQVSLPLTNLVQAMMECRSPPRLYVITQGTAIGDGFDVTNPTSGTLHGIIKSLSNESSELPVRSLDLEPNEPAVNQVDKIFQEFWGSDKGARSIAFRDDDRLCMKLISAKVNNNEPLALPSGCDRYQLQLPETRMLSDLEFGPLDHQTLEDNEIEVHVKAMALNFRDVFAVLKPIAQFENINSVGLDFAGEVVKVGANVTMRKVGDRVIGMNMNENLSLPSHIKIEEQLVVPLPLSYTYTEGVTLPAVFSTVVLCLIKIAKMKRGDTVLIHTASGGVGLCAIQVARHVGANVIATAGSTRKQNYLRNLGIKHVFHSRTTQFGQQITEVTNGRGVDIVLNSITGAGFKEASLSALAKNGRFIEMSKLSVWSPEEVKEMRPDVFYQLVDLTTLDKSESQELLRELKEYLSTETILPIPYERFDAVNIRGALNYLQKAKHIGKIVCVMPDVKVENSKLITTTPQFNEYSTYLVTGGLGGIGFEVVKWMLSNGAKHIAIASRSPPKPYIVNQIESWNKSGKHVEAFAIDIGDYSQCQHLFQELASPAKGFPQIRGVMHAAGVLSDATIENQTWSKFRYTYNPKVEGTWNLHDLTKDMMLEHFVLFSSIAASIGSPGQSNHAASNHFEDALAAYRRSNGLPATSVNWGNWGEVGVATELDFPGVRPIGTAQGILALETFLKTQESHICVANFESFALAVKLFPSLKNYVDDNRLFGETKATVLVNSDDFWNHMDSAESHQGKTAIFKDLIKSILKNILKMEPDEMIDDHSDFQTLGVDSLMMLEMKNGLQSILGSRITLTANHVKDCNNTTTLANRLFEVLKGEGYYSKPILPAFDELQELVKADSILPEHIRPYEGQAMCEMSKIETVLLTGATGVLGPYMLRELCQRPSIKKIICLVRKIGKMSPTERVLDRLRVINLLDQIDMTKVKCIQGDVTEDRFGLSEAEYNDLAQNVDAVVNSAVRADHTGKYFKAPATSKLDIRSVNVKGTERVLEFAVKGNKLKHVYHGASILSIITTDDDDEEDEDCYDLEKNNDMEFATEDWQAVDAFDQLPFNLGYPLSKHVAEQLCQQAAERGIPCKTFRLPVIGGDSKTGRCDYRSNHVILRWLTYMKLECMPDMPMPMMIIPVDECARISLEVFFHPESPLDVYNIVHPGKSVDQIMTKIAKEFGINIKIVSLREFSDTLLQMGDDSPLSPFMKLYRDDEEEMFELLEQNDTVQGILNNAENNQSFFRSKKLAQFVEGYHNLEPTESVMRRDIRYLKESGVFQKFGIKCSS